MHLQENTLFDPRPWAKVTLNVAQYPLNHVTYTAATLGHACLYSATLSDMHAGFIYSDTSVCKVLLRQARNSK